jgi:uncharacterized membrane protein YhhN
LSGAAAARRAFLPVAAVVSAALAIAAGVGWIAPALLFVFKPLTTLLVIAHAWRRDGGPTVVRRWVLAGLVLSLAGDVALLWPKEGFVPGLVSFLLAHLSYLVAFTRVAPLASRRWPFAVYALVAGGILSLLWPGVPAALRVPVVAYVVCLATMAAQAAVVWRRSADGPAASRGAVLAFGGLLFVTSDALLATNKFAVALPLSSLWILATYWAAQWCIASWLRPRGLDDSTAANS